MINFLKNLFKGPDISAIIKEGAVIVDVRTKKEYKSGHLRNALNIPVNVLDREAKKLVKKNKPVVLYCQSGTRSRMGTRILKSKGIEAVNGGSLWKMQKVISKL